MGNEEGYYGICACGEALMPVWFREKEYDTAGGARVYTGRTRRAVDCLTCPCCLRDYPVDDSFDGPWERR